MSVIVARSEFSTTTIYDQIPAVSVQTIVAIGDTRIVDKLPTNAWRAIKWYVTIIKQTSLDTRSFEAYATHQSGSNESYNVTSVIGDPINFQVSAIISGGDLGLEILNNDSEDLLVYITRVAVPYIRTAIDGKIGLVLATTAMLVGTGDTEILDSISELTNKGVKWIITVTDPANGNKSTSQVVSSPDSTNTGQFVQYGFSGNVSPTDYTIDVVVSNTSLQLLGINNIGGDLLFNVTRIPIQIQLPPFYVPPNDTQIGIYFPAESIIGGVTTTTVDGDIGIPAHQAVKWLVTIYQPATVKTMAVEMVTTCLNGADTVNLIYGLVGKYLDVDITTAIVDTFLTFDITNNEALPITVNLARLPIPI